VKIKTIIILSLFLTACGSLDDEKTVSPPPSTKYDKENTQQRMINHLFTNVKVDKELYSHVVEFVSMCSLVGGEFTIQCEKRLLALNKVEYVDAFNDSPNVVGRCFYGITLSVPRTVQILKGFADVDSLSMKGLVFHELGHCLLGQDHTTVNSLDLMNPYMMEEEDYGSYWKILVKKLFDIKRLPNEKHDLDLILTHEDTFKDLSQKK